MALLSPEEWDPPTVGNHAICLINVLIRSNNRASYLPSRRRDDLRSINRVNNDSITTLRIKA